MRLFNRQYVYHNKGYCPSCDSNVIFRAKQDWLRDHYFCSKCGSLPRERALTTVIEKYYPNWKDLTIHESSPEMRGTSLKLMQGCPQYSSSQFFPDAPSGQIHNGVMNQNLESLTFLNESIDIFITQDVMEHILDPAKAFQEIGRVLKKGGAHIFTVPILNRANPSERWAERNPDGRIRFLKSPEYHGSPVNPEGCPVTMHWGYDICDFIYKSSGLYTTIFLMDNPKLGIEAEYLEVMITRKQ